MREVVTNAGLRLRIRSLDYADLDDVVNIDVQVTGDSKESRTAYWRRRMSQYVERHPLSCLAAVTTSPAGGEFAGFIIGDIRGWEAGVPQTTGWLETVGVNREFRRKGVARALLGELLASFNRAGANVVYTLADWDQEGLLSFYRSCGFRRSKYILLERQL